MVQRKKPRSSACARAQLGVSMIELLVAMVIFAFGTLGLVGLQTRTLAFGQSSLYRSQATALTDDVLDRLRTDRANAKAGSWNTDFANASSSITGSLLYQTELKDWKQQAEALLPAGKAKIDVEVGTNIVTIWIQWDESRMGGESTQTFKTISRL